MNKTIKKGLEDYFTKPYYTGMGAIGYFFWGVSAFATVKWVEIVCLIIVFLAIVNSFFQEIINPPSAE